MPKVAELGSGRTGARRRHPGCQAACFLVAREADLTKARHTPVVMAGGLGLRPGERRRSDQVQDHLALVILMEPWNPQPVPCPFLPRVLHALHQEMLP